MDFCLDKVINDQKKIVDFILIQESVCIVLEVKKGSLNLKF